MPTVNLRGGPNDGQDCTVDSFKKEIKLPTRNPMYTAVYIRVNQKAFAFSNYVKNPPVGSHYFKE